MNYAGFWRRVAAALIDLLFVGILSAVFCGIVAAGLFFISRSGAVSGNVGDAKSDLVGYSSIVLFIAGPLIISWLYFAKLESSARRATFGKESMKICVTDVDGNRLTFGRASARHFAKVLSAIPAYIGFLMIAFTAKKQGLHDMITSSVVVSKTA